MFPKKLKRIKIKPSVSCRTYNFESDNSKSWVIDDELHCQYLLENEASDMWYVISTTETYKEVFQYAQKRNVENELNEFLLELQNANLISVENLSGIESLDNVPKEIPFKKSSLKGNELVDCEFREETTFDEEKSAWLYKNGYLETLVLQLTYKCNLQCKHCFNDKDDMCSEMTFEQAKKAIDEAYELGITTVGITGGECTVAKDFLKIAKYVREKRLSLNILTNAVNFYDNENLFEEFASIYPSWLKISLYSMNPEIHDFITGQKGSFEKTVSVIKKFVGRGISVDINHLSFMINKDSYPDVKKFGNEIGCNVNYSTFYVCNHNNSNENLRITDDELVKKFLNKDYPYSVYDEKFAKREFVQEPRTACRAAQVVIAVAPNLDINPCNDFKYKLGNLQNDSLLNVYKTSVIEFCEKFLKTNLKECFSAPWCKHCVYCGVHAIFENGFMKKSISSCESANAYYQAMQIKNRFVKH